MRIAIVKLSALGDIVHAMVVLQFIKRAIPQCRIDWIVEENFADILKNNPHIDTVLTVNLKALKKDKLKFFSELSKVRNYAKNRYDIVIDMQGLLKSAVVSRILGPNAGFDKKSIREKIAVWFYRKTFFIPYEENVIIRNMDLAAASLGFDVEHKALENKEAFLFFTDTDKVKTANFLKKDQKNIVHVLGSSWQSKIYPKEKFLEIIASIEENHLLVWGSDTEYEYAQYIARNSDAQVLPHLDLNELKALVASADLVIGGDSGPTHFAWALNRPSITIFGPTPSKRNVLETKINKVIDCDKVIDPLKLDKKDMCIHTIDPEKIVVLAEELLA
ncbi:lipopolysaccharide heptosyltransferase I [Sulfurovum riftiae]|uniref:Lipopolysaccharide heptosyltransferase 1 n=1 Tax=Sulfurovum riftiae TaxID=1630136 RepID=A0A151CFL9_9BACT|nr:lipopolysaccharide heptosyltransferase I [Sulfurovum riftiae]KYJ86325.1 lipopolysaccharide heptosyltransferase I [Sulfurovum riftiae]